ncbi:MAG: hypothetical protein IJ699_04490 [Bacteroidaceae bacterium]|nr:hypothetical protein [Bacteroidaceae bacterium]
MSIKKFLFTAMLCMIAGRAIADEVTIGDVTVAQGGESLVSISLTNPNNSYTAGQMLLTLPEGVTAVLNNNGYPVTTKGERITSTDHSIGASHLDDGTNQFTIFSISSEAILENNGVLFTVAIAADASIAVGTKLTGYLSNIEMTTIDATPTPFNNQTFTITIGEPADIRTVLDETSTTVPVASDGEVDVRVKRTITGNVWSTICLPFSMTATQMQDAFGDDVELADFTGYEAEEDESGNIVGITVNFAHATTMEANHPYIIKVAEAITEFTVDGVTIDPEDEPTVATVKRTRKAWSELIGTYVAQTEVPSKTLFLNANKFWYSTGATKMKGYRAYFDFYDVLTNVDEAYEIKMFIDFDGIETTIEAVNFQPSSQDYFDLSGRKVMKPQRRGMYIANGNKLFIK